MAQVGEVLLNIVSIFLQAYQWILLAYAVLSWVVSPMSTFMQFLRFLVEPIVSPIRRLMAPLTEKSAIPIDLSLLVAWVLIIMVQNAVDMLNAYLY